jgi:hypothetical protein
MWRIFGLRAGPDEEIVFVAHAKSGRPWRPSPGRNKILDGWIKANPGREEVPLGEAPDRPTAMRMAARIARETQPALQRKRGRRPNRRLRKAEDPGAPEAKDGPAAPAAAPRYRSRRALERAFAAAGWTLEEEIGILARIARDDGHTRQLDAMALLAKRRAEAEDDLEDEGDAALSAAAARHGGLDERGRDAGRRGAGGGAGEGDAGHRRGGQGGGQGGGQPEGEGPGEHQGGSDGFGWIPPSALVPGHSGAF